MRGQKVQCLLALAKRLEKAQKKHDNVGIELDAIHCDLTETYLPALGLKRPGRRPIEHAHRLNVLWKANGTAAVSIDNIPPFSLPLVSAHLLEVLAIDGPNVDPADLPYVPFKSYRAIMAEMSRRLGRCHREHTLKQAVYRLKLQLYPYRCEALVVNNRHKKAYRFLLVSKTAAVGAAAL